ncbi:MAG: DUF6090 family protein [Candidatus Neomarinimicrobiota bacterium]|tara:strand:+ start:1438 stop:2112 length:675 start_codon:yes stop_codon:yes gene_type:complete
MKNTLARGGIEFIAVFLGIALSFYVEEWQDTNKQKDLLNKDCKNILLDVNEDIGTINNVIESNKDDLKSCNAILRNVKDISLINVDSLLIHLSSLGYPTFFGITKSYKLSYSTGRLNLYGDDTLISEISRLYDHYYERLKINSDIYDQVSLRFFDRYVSKNIAYARNGFDYDKKELEQFFSEKVFINEVLTFRGRVGNYISRLQETKDQLHSVKDKLEDYIENN